MTPSSTRKVSAWLSPSSYPLIFGVQPSRFLPLKSGTHSSLSFNSWAGAGAIATSRSAAGMMRGNMTWVPGVAGAVSVYPTNRRTHHACRSNRDGDAGRGDRCDGEGGRDLRGHPAHEETRLRAEP